MNSFRKYLRLPAILIFCFLITLQNIAAQQRPVTFDYPSVMTPYDWQFSLGMGFSSMPSDIVLESSTIRWPIIKFAAQIGLPANFVLDARLSTQLVTNHLEFGVRWVYEFSENFHAHAELSLAYFFGQLKISGFDTNINGWFSYPSLGIGYDFGEMTLSAIGAISYINSLSSTSGDLETIFNISRLNGFYYRIALEQPFYKNTSIGLAFQMSYLRFYYPEWPLFPAIDRYFWIPELQLWILL